MSEFEDVAGRDGSSPISSISRRTVLAGAAGSALGLIADPKLVHAQSAGSGWPIKLQLQMGSGALNVYDKACIVAYPIHFIAAAQPVAGPISTLLELAGPTEADMRQLANEAYADLWARLAQIGYQMVPAQQAGAHPDMAKIGYAKRNAVLLSGDPDPYGRRIWVAISADKAPLLNGNGGARDGFESSLPSKLKNVSRDLGAMMLIPRLVIDFSGIGPSVKSGENWARYFVGGNVRMRVKDFTTTYVWAGGPKSHQIVVNRFWLSGRNKEGSLDVESPWPLRGKMEDVNGPLPDWANKKPERIDYKLARVNVADWRDQIRAAFRSYNAAMVEITASKRRR